MSRLRLCFATSPADVLGWIGLTGSVKSCRLDTARFSASVKLQPYRASRSTSIALNKTRAPIFTGLSFLVRASQWRVVSPIRKTAKASARLNKSRGGLLSIRGTAWLFAMFCLLLKRANDWRAGAKLGELAVIGRGTFRTFFAVQTA